jgi:hypothetical protein
VLALDELPPPPKAASMHHMPKLAASILPITMNPQLLEIGESFHPFGEA